MDFLILIPLLLLAALAVWLIVGKGEDAPSVSAPDSIDPSSYLQGGLKFPLLNPYQAVGVTHWTLSIGDSVTAKTKKGEFVTRTIKEIKVLGDDVSIITFDQPLSAAEHHFYPVHRAEVGPALINRIDRPPLLSRIVLTFPKLALGGGEKASTEPTENAYSTGTNPIRSGDSGGGGYQTFEGVDYLVWITSEGWNGKSPRLHDKLQPYLSK